MLVLVGCSGGNSVSGVGSTGTDGGSTTTNPPPPPVVDAGTPDSGTPPPVADGGDDAGTPPPADGGTADAGTLTMTPGSLDAGPWPTTNVTYGAADGIQETPIVGFSTDESQNLYVATQSALYVRTPTASSFTRFASADGLHLPGHDMDHCYDPSGRNNGILQPCPSSDADSPGISEIVGGGPNEVLVGYWGHEDFTLGNLPDGTPIDGTSSDPWRHTGKVDRVRLRLDGATGNVIGIDVVKLDVVSTNSNEFWHNRTVERMIYDHFTNRHELYVGFNHGVDKLTPDLWAEPDPKLWFLNSYAVWMSDHLHPQVCLHATCTGEGSDTQMLGDWRGLAIDAKGDLWVGGRWAAGKIRYTASNADWYNTPRKDGNAIAPALGDGYDSSLCGTSTAPVFCPPQEGDPVNISATTVTPDGKIWWGSGTLFGDPRDIPYGLASFDGHHFTYFTPASVGMSEETVRDLIALPDGRLVIASLNTGLVIWNPSTGQHTAIHAGQGIPSDRIYRMELDMMVSPPALHVSTASGAATLRVFP
ncbi:MAG TPA: WD40 repeat domain-containing protein [Myxococcales bacterium]|nr:WD40 repeat domain-containing protein [Myxococcales bacterium]